MINRRKPLVIILNGPPFSGKDYIGEVIMNTVAPNDGTWGLFQFKEELFKEVRKHYGVDKDRWDRYYERDLKEVPLDTLKGLSPRQAMIHVSEEVIKPKHGKSFFGEKLKESIDASGVRLAIVTDGGFKEELEPLVKAYGKENVVVFRVFSDTTSFEGDSRRYIKASDNVVDHIVNVYNDGKTDSVINDVGTWLFHFYGLKPVYTNRSRGFWDIVLNRKGIQ